jgi:hypothetical protein
MWLWTGVVGRILPDKLIRGLIPHKLELLPLSQLLQNIPDQPNPILPIAAGNLLYNDGSNVDVIVDRSLCTFLHTDLAGVAEWDYGPFHDVVWTGKYALFVKRGRHSLMM